MLGPHHTVTPPRRTSFVGATLVGALSGAITAAILVYVLYPTSLVVQPTPLTNEPQKPSPPSLVDVQKTPVSEAVMRAQNSIVSFYRINKGTVLTPDDRIAIGVAVTSDGWVALPEEAFTHAPTEVVAVARGTESVVEKKITDPFSHITFVKIKREDLQVVPFADGALPIGSSVTEFNKANRLSFGFLTNPRRHLGSTPQSSEVLDVTVETTTPQAPGSILFAADGSLIGIAGRKDMTTPGTAIRDATKLLLKKGAFTRPKLSITVLDLSSVVVRKKQLPSDGAWVTKKSGAAAIVKKSAADIAGMKEGDVITKVDSIEINTDHTLAEAISLYTSGTTIPFTIWRGGATVELTVSL